MRTYICDLHDAAMDRAWDIRVRYVTAMVSRRAEVVSGDLEDDCVAGVGDTFV